MTFNFFRLVVLLTTPALRRAGAAMALALAFWLAPFAAHAAQDNFNGGNVTGCTRAGSTYNCPTLSQVNDITIASGYTVVVGTDVSFTYAQVLKMSGSAVLRASGDLDLRGLQTNNTQVAGGTLAADDTFRLGANDQTVTANVTAAAIATGGPSTRINGNVTVGGLANLGSSTTITGTLTAATVTAGSSLRIDGGIDASGTVSLSSASTVKGGITGIPGINGGRSGAVTTGSSSTISGNISASAFTLASGSSLAGDIDAPTVELSAANAIVVGNITATTSLVVGSGASVTGKIDSPKVDLNASGVTIKGDINAGTSLTIGSGNTVNGNLTGTALTIAASNVVVNGNVTMKGDIDIGSGATINGDLSARNVTTHASGDNINGNASVNAIFLDYGASVSKTITCTGAGASGCSCVTRADSNYKPTCGAPPPSGVHHFRITQPGSALTCQPQPVTVTACANSACALPNYTGTATVTLQPGGKSFSFSGGETTSATVEQTTAGTATLSATGALNAATCVNTSTSDPSLQCQMKFGTTGLDISASNHVSMAGGATVTIQAKKASAQNQSCVPLVANQTVNIDLSCAFDSPAADKAADVNVKVGSASLDCRKAAVAVPFAFDKDGYATVPLQYAEVGRINLNGSFAGAGFNAIGSSSFIAAPKEFLIEATSVLTKANTATMAADGVFARASEGFIVKISAVNGDKKVTTNFGKETSAEGITITSGIANIDANGNPDAARKNGLITAGKFKVVSGGVYTSLDDATGLWSFSDTGAIKLDVTLFNPTGYYMGFADKAFKTAGTLTVARFVPDHFDTVLMSNQEVDGSVAPPAIPAEGRSMSCAGLSDATRPCGPATTSFVHSGQPFFVKVLAYNGATPPALTLNHSGAYAKAVTLSALTAAGGSVATAGGQLDWIRPADGALTTGVNFAFDKGVGKLAAPVDNMPRFLFSAKDVLPVTTYIRAVDSDGVTSKRPTPPAPAPQIVSVEAPLTVVSGRLLVANTYGSPNGSVPVDASAQYYMPVGYVFNPQVQATSGAIANFIKFDNCVKGLAGRCPAMKAAPAPSTLVLKNGKGTFRVAPPTPVTTEIGWAEVSLGSLIYYLPSSVGRATFGIYRSGPVVYRREVY
ncbi:polymer-forming cytoskeletal protein [Oxalobacteraceae bacterium OTU3CINTB1]|nr:polymer-forming cytoskeletal protein [Oxalobacteraceae bacterium OTU3CINTB1]